MDFTVEINILTSADISDILGCSLRTAQRQMSEIRDAYGLSNHAIITIERFIDYFELDPKDIHIRYKSIRDHAKRRNDTW